MLIRTQDKTELVNVNNVTRIILINNRRIAIEIKDNERWTTLGEYPEEKAIEIFNAIHDLFGESRAEQYDILQYFTRHPNLTEKTSSVFVMPEVEV